MSPFSLVARMVRAALTKLVAGMPDRVRYEIQRHQHLEPVVERTPPTRVIQLEGWRWRCPDANYDWHYAVDDQGHAETPHEALALGAEHVQRFHRVRWSEHADRLTPPIEETP